MTTPLSPDQIEQSINELSNRIARGVRVCAERYSAFLEADRDFDQAVAMAYVGANDHPAHERKYLAELATLSERQRRDEADAAYRYADRQAKALELELRALQSVGASVRAMYTVAGRGET